MNLKTVLICLFILTSIYGTSYAHEATLPLEQHQMDISLYWETGSGIEYWIYWEFDPESLPVLVPTELIYSPMATRYNFAYGGFICLFEYGIFDFLSAGIRINIFDFFLRKIMYGKIIKVLH